MTTAEKEVADATRTINDHVSVALARYQISGSKQTPSMMRRCVAVVLAHRLARLISASEDYVERCKLTSLIETTLQTADPVWMSETQKIQAPDRV